MLFTKKRKQKAFDKKYDIALTKTIRYMEKRKKETNTELAITPTIIMQKGLTDDMEIAKAIIENLDTEGKIRYDPKQNQHFYSCIDYI